MKEELRKGGTPRAGWGEELINLKRERLTHKSLRAFQNIIGPLDIPHPTESIIHAVCSLMIHPQTICTSLNFFFKNIRYRYCAGDHRTLLLVTLFLTIHYFSFLSFLRPLFVNP